MSWFKNKIDSLSEERKKKEKQENYKTAKESIEFLLHKGFTTQESVKLFQEVSEVFTFKMKQRLSNITEEKIVLEQFLNIKNEKI